LVLAVQAAWSFVLQHQALGVLHNDMQQSWRRVKSA
jgi:hypothetical protein